MRHRRQITYPSNLGVNTPISDIMEDKQSPFALYHTNRKLSLEPKVSRRNKMWIILLLLGYIQIPVNTRVVFIGASDTVLSCLEAMVFR